MFWEPSFTHYNVQKTSERNLTQVIFLKYILDVLSVKKEFLQYTKDALKHFQNIVPKDGGTLEIQLIRQ